MNNDGLIDRKFFHATPVCVCFHQAHRTEACTVVPPIPSRS